MIEQKRGLLDALSYRIDTTEGTVELEHRKKQIIDLRGDILRIGSSHNSYKGYKDFTDLYETCYYGSSEKRIVVYFYYYKYGIRTIDDLNTILFVEPFEQFNGFYTDYFIFENNLYQAVSLNSEIGIGEFVEEFEYKKIKQSKISQYKRIGPYGEKEIFAEKENNENGVYSFTLNYIFQEEIDPRYTKL